MLLISPQEAALGIGGKCGGSSPGTDDSAMKAVINYILPRMEGALNVRSLVREEVIDTFYVGPMPTGSDRPVCDLRLANGFVVADSVILTAPDGTITTGADVPPVQLEEGVLRMESWSRGLYRVQYSSGFLPITPDPLPAGYDPDLRVLADVPLFIRALCINLLVVWYRVSQMKPVFPTEMSFGQVSQSMQRELYARVYEKYMRPRVGMIFTERTDRVA